MKAEPPDEKHRERHAEDDVGVNGAEFVGEFLRGRFLLLRFLDERDDFLQRTFGGGPGDEHFDRAPEIDGAGERGVADVFFDGRGFAGEIGFVGGGAAFGDFRVHGKLRAGLDEQPHAGADFFHRHFAFAAPVVKRGGNFRRVAEQRADFLLRAAQRVMFQRAGKRKQEQQRRAFRPRADAGRADGDGEHQKMHVNRAFLQAFPDFLRREKSAGEIGGDKRRNTLNGAGEKYPASSRTRRRESRRPVAFSIRRRRCSSSSDFDCRAGRFVETAGRASARISARSGRSRARWSWRRRRAGW